MTPSDLRALRARYGWTQRYLAALIGMQEITVRRWELGLRTMDGAAHTLLRLIDHPTYGIRIRSLLEDEAYLRKAPTGRAHA